MITDLELNIEKGLRLRDNHVLKLRLMSVLGSDG